MIKMLWKKTRKTCQNFDSRNSFVSVMPEEKFNWNDLFTVNDGPSKSQKKKHQKKINANNNK